MSSDKDILKLRPFFDRFKLKYYRSMRAFSQGVLAEMSGFNGEGAHIHIGMYERGRRKPQLRTIRRIAEALDVRPEQLMSTEEELIQTELRYEQAMLAREMLRDETITRHSEHLKRIQEHRAARRAKREERRRQYMEQRELSNQQDHGRDQEEDYGEVTTPSVDPPNKPLNTLDQLYQQVVSQEDA